MREPLTSVYALSSIIIPPNRLRALREDVVEVLVESMRQRGLLQPIVVRCVNGEGYYLIAGHHRYEAARRLKWDSIKATNLAGIDADAAKLAEIDENLIRAELSPAERAAHHAERKAIYERLHPETKHGAIGRGRKKSSQVANSKSYADDAAEKTGKHKATVARDAKRGKAIKDVASLAGTSLDKGEELDALASRVPGLVRR
jgi:ParB/RepB/Spo0J family partition protein